MGASFAKAVMPRVRREGENRREADWCLGWVFPVKSELPADAEAGSSKVALCDIADPTPGSLTTEEAALKIIHD